MTPAEQKLPKHFDAIVHPATGPLSGRLTAQPSKNYTTRYLLAAGLGDGTSTVQNCATSADARALQTCLHQMGARLEATHDAAADRQNFQVHGVAGKLRLLDPKEPVNPGNAGAVLRLLLGVAATMPDVTFVTDHLESLGKRPNGDLLDALVQLGCEVQSDDGRLPITLKGGNLHGGKVTVSGARSSQFISGLLYLAPLVGEPVEIQVVDDLVSRAPIRQTLEVLREAGIQVEAAPDLMSFSVKPGGYSAGTYTVNGDWPGSAALLSAAAVTKGKIQLDGLFDDEQGEKMSGTVLANMGAQFEFQPDGITFSGTDTLRGVEFDGDLATDAVLALMGAACFAEGKTRFFNVSNLRIKECDRITEPIQELRKLGVKCWEGNEIGDPDPDAIIIEGNPDGYEGGVTVDGRDDHRVIMLLSIVALRCKKPVRILRAHEISKSYPHYFDHIRALGAQVDFEAIDL